MDFQKGQSFRAIVPFSIEPLKVHIDHVLPSIYQDRQLIVYRAYGKHKQYWHEFMCAAQDMEWYIGKAKEPMVKVKFEHKTGVNYKSSPIIIAKP